MFNEKIDCVLMGMKLLDYTVFGLFTGQSRYLHLKYKANFLWNNSCSIHKDHITIFINPYVANYIGEKIVQEFNFDRFELSLMRTFSKKEEFYQLDLYGNIDSIIKMIVEFDDVLPNLDVMIDKVL